MCRRFGIGKVDSHTTAHRVGGCAIVPRPRVVLKVVLAWAWHILLQVLVNQVCFCVHVHFGSLGDPRCNGILAGTWHLLLALLHHAFSYFGSNAPSSSLELGSVGVGVVLSWTSLVPLCLLDLQVTASPS